MFVKHLRAAVAAVALVTVAAVPAYADPWARDVAPTVASSPAHTGAGLHARSVALNERYGIGVGTTTPLVTHQDGSDGGFDRSTAGIAAVVVLVAAGGAAVVTRRRPAPGV